MDCTKANLSLRRGPQPVYSQVHSHSPLHKKWCVFHQDLSNSPYPYPSSRRTYIRMSETSSLLLIHICRASLPLQTTPASVTVSYLGWENKLFLPHCTWGSLDTITFAGELQMSLWLQPANHISFLWPVRLCCGVHTHDTGTEADVHTWIRMS